MSGTNLLQSPGLDPVQRRKNIVDEREEILNPVRSRHNQDYAEGQGREFLLALKFPIHRDKRVGVPGRVPQKIAVLDARPSHALNGRDLVSRQWCNQIVRQILVKQDAHWSAHCRAPAQAPRWPAHA